MKYDPASVAIHIALGVQRIGKPTEQTLASVDDENSAPILSSSDNSNGKVIASIFPQAEEKLHLTFQAELVPLIKHSVRQCHHSRRALRR